MDFRKLDSMTKYSSIETFHALGEKGLLAPTLTIPGSKLVGSADISGTEKINGTNARIIFHLAEVFGDNLDPDLLLHEDWFLGSRENLVMARGDRIPNPAQGIAEYLVSVAERLLRDWPTHPCKGNEEEELGIIYGEFYGGNIGSDAKNYARDGSVGFRVFDIRTMTTGDYLKTMEMPVEKIAHMRDAGTLAGHWLTDPERKEFCAKVGLEEVPFLLPVIPLPGDLASAYEWMKAVAGEKTRAALGIAEPGRPEGVVVRTPDRSAIAKLRFQEYERTLRSK